MELSETEVGLVAHLPEEVCFVGTMRRRSDHGLAAIVE
jgi:hypothetical protein